MKMNIAALVLESKSVTFDHPIYEGFSVELNYLSKTKMASLRKQCVETKFDPNLGVPSQVLNQEEFNKTFCTEVIKSWKGLTVGYLASMLLIDETGLALEDEVSYSTENAVTLLTQSTAFDDWVNSCLSDLNNFRK